MTAEFMTILCLCFMIDGYIFVYQEEYISFDKLECSESGMCENFFQYSNIFMWSCVIFV